MQPYLIRFVLLPSMAILLLASGCRERPFLNLEEIRIGIGADARDWFEPSQRSAFISYLERESDKPVRFVEYRTDTAVLRSFLAGEIELAVLDPILMEPVLRNQAGHYLAAALVNGTRYFPSAWYMSRDNERTSLEEMRGRMACFPTDEQGALYWLALGDLVKRGWVVPHGVPELFFGAGQVFYAHGHDEAAQRLIDGKALAAPLPEPAALPVKTGYSALHARLAKIADIGKVPSDVLILRGDLPESDAVRLREILAGQNPAIWDPVPLKDHLAPLIQAVHTSRP